MRRIIKVDCHVVNDKPLTKKDIFNKVKGLIDNNDLSKAKEFVNQLSNVEIDDENKTAKIKSNLDFADWYHDTDSDTVVDPSGKKYRYDTDEYRDFMDHLWKRVNGKYLAHTGYEGWIHRSYVDIDVVVDPDGKIYTTSDPEYWDMLKIYNLRKKKMGCM